MESLGSNWIRFGSSSLQDEKISGRIRVIRRAMPSMYKSFVRSVLDGMESDLILVGMAIHD